MSEVVIKTNNLCKRYGNRLVVNNVCMSINQGDIYGFVGQNGAGKTTLMRLIANLISNNGGSIDYLSLEKGFIGGIIEQPSLYLNLSVLDNLKIQATVLGIKDFSRIDEVLNIVDLLYLKDSKKKTASLSLGMKQRLGIAIALLNEPKFLLLDEPMNGLDPKGIVDIRNLILKLNSLGVTILISSHNLEELSKVATKYGFIHSGVLIEEISAVDLESRLSSFISVEVSNMQDIDNLLVSNNITEYRKVNNRVNIKTDLSVTDLVLMFNNASISVLKCNCVNQNIEDYYIKLVGGMKNV